MNAMFMIAGYFAGSIPNAYWVGKFFKRADVRKIGTRNVGALNIFLSIGFLPGLLTLFSDLLKCASIVFLSTRYGNLDTFNALPIAVASMVVLGHNFNVFLGLRGGKGMSCVVGTLLVLFPLGILILYAVVGILALILRNLDAATGLAVIAFPFIIHHKMPDSATIVFSTAIVIMILFKHKGAFLKLLHGQQQTTL